MMDLNESLLWIEALESDETPDAPRAREDWSGSFSVTPVMDPAIDFYLPPLSTRGNAELLRQLGKVRS